MHILLVEDDITISENIRDSLLAENYTVELAFDGLTAGKWLRKSAFDCVILDINLPHKNGYEVCREFRLRNVSTPVLMLTAFDELEDKAMGFDCGADDYLTKPFYTREVLMRVKALIKRSANAATVPLHPDTWAVEDLVIFPATKQVKRSNREILLTPREYQILVKLVQARGAVVSKKELVSEIWGGGFDANTNTIEVFINFLRKKVDKPFSKPLIKTKVGFGYYLDV